MSNYSVRTGTREFLELSESIPIIDVRSPSEFRKGHIPSASNIPLFSDEERAVVGTVYKQKNQLSAIMKGLDIVGPKMSGLLKEGIKLAGEGKKLLVYCWRGGSRSESMAWLFGHAGIDCVLLEGGYKAYRNYILKELSGPRNMIIVGGLTGSGKTDILAELAASGEQVVDLEGLACHKGSAFGALGQLPQPGTEHFANLLYDVLRKQDSAKRVFVEDESHNIGQVNIPEGFFRIMREAPVIALMPDITVRLPRLIKEYGNFSKSQLADSVMRISKKLGGTNTKAALSAIQANDLEPAIEIVLGYYDRTYRYGLSQRPEHRVVFVDSPSASASSDAEKVRLLADEIRA